MSHRRFLDVVALAVAALASSGALGQTGRYYITDEDQPVGSVWTVQGGNIVNQWFTSTGARHGAIAVGPSDVRTLPEANGGGPPVIGDRHTLGGAFLGPLPGFFPAPVGAGRIIDGAFDGRNTYVVSGFDIFGGTGEVWAFGPDFDGPGAFMFRAGINDQGITYDTRTNTIWTSEYNFTSGSVGFVKQWSLTGSLMSQFPVIRPFAAGLVESERNTALAYDPSDDTLWLNAHVENTLTGTTGELWQFDRFGNFLQAIDPTPNSNVLYWGGEFNIPAPSGVAALTVAAVGLVLRRRRHEEPRTE
ncbi:MAG TPA: hypothetical protein DEB06_06660 [Phycisphaerales bacterium]|nr:hypothetical protein [Phycisphaerales bacterium]